MSAPQLELIIEASAWRNKRSWAARFRRALKTASAHAGRRKKSTLCVMLTNDKKIAAHNRRWRGKNKPTNVLSFPAGRTAEPGFLGDIVLAHETIAREAKEQGKTIAVHATHMLIHGYLHLLGYRHNSERAARRMEGLERKIMLALGLSDPYA